MKKIYLFLCLLTSYYFTSAQAGSLDPSFGVNGIEKINYKAKGPLVSDKGESYRIDIKQQGISTTVKAYKYFSNGAPDPSYGTIGSTLPFGMSGFGSAIEDDGTLLMIGTVQDIYQGSYIVVVHFGLDGSSTYSTMKRPYSSGHLIPAKLIKQGDKVILFSYFALFDVTQYQGQDYISVNGSGLTPISPWRMKGQYYAPNSSTYALGKNVAMGGGSVIVAGPEANQIPPPPLFPLPDYSDYIAKYGNGAQTFGTNGKIPYPNIGDSRYMLLAPNQKLIIVNSVANPNTGNTDFRVIRFNLNGSFDQTFNGAGIQTIDFGGDDSPNSIAVQDGKLIVAGVTTNKITGEKQFAIVRYNDDGTLDNSFSNGGKVTLGEAGNAYNLDQIKIKENRLLALGTAVSATGDSSKITAAFLLEANHPPVITINAPANGATLSPPATINITANASDPDGPVAKVDFYSNNQWLGEDFTAPFEYSFTNVAVGTYSITARATDNTGTITTSDPVSVTVTLAAPGCTATGRILQESWYAPGTKISDIPVSTKPSFSTAQRDFFETSINSTVKNFAERLRGYICAPVSGNYTFYVAGDDECELWLSTDYHPSTKKKIAFVPDWTNSREWTKYESQKSATIYLEANTRYYIEAIHKQGEGASNFAAGWITPGSSEIDVIPGSVLSAFTDPIVTIGLSLTLTAPGVINIYPTIENPAGRVSKVEFFNGTSKIGESLTPPYQFSLRNVAAGTYSITARFTDDHGLATTSAPTSVTVKPGCTASGTILREYWANVPGNLISNIPVNTTPSSTSQLNNFEAPTDVADNYAQRIRGYICAPATGNYTFYISGDDESELWLSTSDNPADKRKIASVDGMQWTNPREWTKYGSQKSVTIFLEANTKYYIEALNKEGAGGDNLAVGWITPGASDIVVIPGSVLSPFTGICTASGTILREYWANVTGNLISDIPANTTPSSISQLNSFEAPTDIADDYAQRIRGYICAPATGNYTFYISGDDESELWLSTSDNPADKRKIAWVGGMQWTNPREWTKYESQKSVTIFLQANTKYYIEALNKEGAGGDNLAVGWITPGSSSDIVVIPGAVLSPSTDITNQPPTVSITSPINGATFEALTKVNVAATATDPDGTIAKVEFFLDNKFAEDLTAPFETDLTFVATQKFSITAKATDNLGLSSTSAPVYITVIPKATSGCTATGTIVREYWANVPGTLISDIPVNATPSSTSQLNSFEAPTDIADNYAQRIRGYICAPVTGQYFFYISGDDESELWLSTTDNPADKRKVAFVGGNQWTNPREWNKYYSQRSVAIGLQANTRYYIEALNKEGVGGDNLAVGWVIPSSFDINVIPGSVLSPFAGTTDPPVVCTATGSILREYWENVPGNLISDIPVNTTPSSTSQLNSFEAPTDMADYYAQRIRGYICAPATGNYTFYISGDDESELWLSTNGNPADKRKIASVGGMQWTNPREWTKYESQKSVTIFLQANTKYYIEALNKEGAGGDNLAVGWITPSTSDIVVVPGSVLSPFAGSTNQPSFVTIPTPSVTSNFLRKVEDDVNNSQLSLKALPNPTSTHFTINIKSRKSEPVELKVLDAVGRVIETKRKVSPNGSVTIGDRYQSGVYYLQAVQGAERATLKLIKGGF